MVPHEAGQSSEVVQMSMGYDDEVNMTTNQEVSGRISLNLEFTVAGDRNPEINQDSLSANAEKVAGCADTAYFAQLGINILKTRKQPFEHGPSSSF